MPVMKLSQVNKYYPIGKDGQFQALKDVNLQFDKGELVSIIGESGSGKSTLMNLLGGLDTDFSGEIIVNGENIGAYSENELVEYHKSQIGFVFQNFNLIPHLSILENVSLAMTLSNVNAKIRTEQAKRTLEMVGLKEHLNKKPNQLSGGQKQRVAIARALVNNPEIIIADEPTGALDSETSKQVLAIFKEIAASGKLVLIVTHSEQVAAISSRIVTIDDGVIIKDQKTGTPATIVPQIAINEPAAASSRPQNSNLSFLSAVKLALKNMKEKLSRNILIAFGGSIGIMSIIMMLALGAGVNDYLVNTMNAQINPLVSEVRMPVDEETSTEGMNVPRTAGQADGGENSPDLSRNTPPATMMKNAPFAAVNIDELQNIAGVSAVENGYSTFTIGSNTVTANDENYDFMNFQTISAILTEADVATGAFPENGEIMITQGMADSIGGEVIGLEVTLNMVLEDKPVSQKFVISGIYASEDAIGPSAAFDAVYMNYEDVQAMAVENDIDLAPNIIYLSATDEDASATVRAKVEELGYQGSATASLADTFTEMIDIFTYILVGVAALSLVVSAIMILTVLYISVVERTQEIGVLKAIGGRRKDIRRIFVSESFLIGLFSGLIGVGLSSLLAAVGNNVVLAKFGTTIFALKPEYAIMGVLVSVVISMIAGLFPANAAAKLDPVEALRKE